MAKKKTARERAKKSASVAKRRHSTRKRAKAPDPLLTAVKGAERRTIGRVQLDVGRAGAARVKRMVYPVGFHWAVDMKPVVGTDLCLHAHVGFLARGEIHIEYADGCIVKHKAPQIVAIEGVTVQHNKQRKHPHILRSSDSKTATVSTCGVFGNRSNASTCWSW